AALAIATKQQGVFFVPLIVGLQGCRVAGLQGCKDVGLQGDRVAIGKDAGFEKAGVELHDQRSPFHVLRPTLLFLLSLSLSLLPFVIWDLTRSQPSAFFQQSLNNYGGLTFDITGFNERWLSFLDLLWYGTGSFVLNTLFIVGLPFLIIHALIQISRSPTPSTTRSPVSNVQRMYSHAERGNESNAPISRSPVSNVQRMYSHAERGNESNVPISQSPISNLQSPNLQSPISDLLLTLFCLAFLLLHTVFSFQIWDRYLLGLIPLLALLLARVLLLPWTLLHYVLPRVPSLQSGLRVTFSLGLVVLLAATLFRPVQDAIHARYPLGSNSRAVTGIEQIVNYLQGNVGADTTLYHRWLGTYWRFYLWDYPYDLQFWATPTELLDKAQPGHLIAFPAWRSDTEARLALFEAGLGLRELARAYKPDGSPSVILYRIEALAE
ncbi:MAG: hypothetical protein KDJ65_33425, partial [Anaerolineae bacterium]|nr:hypothetical protein [Anaerolineae bacterium]